VIEGKGAFEETTVITGYRKEGEEKKKREEKKKKRKERKKRKMDRKRR
jgi:hypothetical protein